MGSLRSFVEAQGDSLEVARVVLQTLKRRIEHETLADQPTELLLDIAVRGRLRLEGDELLLHGLPVGQDLPDRRQISCASKPKRVWPRRSAS